MINRVVLVGRLTRDVELRYTGNGDAVGSFTVAVERNFTNSAGEREADFISAVIWRKAAENFANFTSKGSMVAIEGSLRTRNYQNNQGQTVYVTEVNVDNFSLLETRAQTEARKSGNGGNDVPNYGNNGGGFNPAPQQNNSFNPAPSNPQPQGTSNNGGFQDSPWNNVSNDNGNGDDGYDISEDDLPFD
ncbi:MAG: single-stranded DNA-binding protein [Lactobacillaceae bacterium]|jgi:single-strand DNA-binding protein|nr:single-stranded DNA-binding protein [Lactobacillaceae bacterium]